MYALFCICMVFNKMNPFPAFIFLIKSTQYKNELPFSVKKSAIIHPGDNHPLIITPGDEYPENHHS